MTESRETLVAIVEECLAMDVLAETLYRKFAENTGDRELSDFWQEMSGEEGTHVAAWTDLLSMLFDREIPSLFQNPRRTLRELRAQHGQIVDASSQYLELSDAAGQFLAALRLEFYLLHPALERLWHFYQILRQPARSPENDYERHLHKFVSAMARSGAASPELQLLGDALLRLWTQMRELSQEASVDVLTRVLNRRGLFNQIKLLAYLSRRNRFTAGALLIDIDQFKLINDTHGHQTGDEVLADVAQLISSCVRRSDIVGRYGGEEFLVFLPQTDRAALASLGEKVRAAVELGTRERIPATVSVGAACIEFSTGVEQGLEALIRTTDRQLYIAKSAGRNTVAATADC